MAARGAQGILGYQEALNSRRMAETPLCTLAPTLYGESEDKDDLLDDKAGAVGSHSCHSVLGAALGLSVDHTDWGGPKISLE